MGRLLPALAGVLTLCSCQYTLDRAIDFTDQYRLAVGVGSVAGARVSTGGVFETGLMVGVKPKAAALGWRYGAPLYFDEKDARMDADQAEIFRTTSLTDLDYTTGSYSSARESLAILPALLTWADSTPRGYAWLVPEEGDDFPDRHWIWSGASFEGNRYEQIHAFDIEAEAGLFIYLDSGYSPGELLDFLLGLFTIDIAKDDGRL